MKKIIVAALIAAASFSAQSADLSYIKQFCNPLGDIAKDFVIARDQGASYVDLLQRVERLSGDPTVKSFIRSTLDAAYSADYLTATPAQFRLAATMNCEQALRSTAKK